MWKGHSIREMLGSWDNNKTPIFEVSENLPKFSPNIKPETVISLRGNKELKIELLKYDEGRYLDSKISCIQFGKMQPDGNTVYSREMIKPFVKYLIDHAKLDDKGKSKVIIQLWPELAQSLSQGDGKKVLTFRQEKGIIEDIIKEFGDEGKDVEIEIQNVAVNYSDVFDAIKVNGKYGLIPEKEPKLECFELPLKSPLQIIKYLAYHCSKDQNLMKLFYDTKPEKYKEQDGEKHKPGDSQADYYAVVEVGIRLFEVLNGKYIQGGIDRQKVYDKIIYLILFGEDKISKEDKKLKLEKYPKLGELHNLLIKYENYKNLKMMQLYIDLSKLEKEIQKQKEKREEEIGKKMELDNMVREQMKLEKTGKHGKEKGGNDKLGLAKYLTMFALLGALCYGVPALLDKYAPNNKGNEISKILKDDSKVLDLSDKDSTELDTIIQNTINSEPIDDYIDYNGSMVPGSLLELQKKGFEYDIDGKHYYCILVIYRDKTFLFAKPKGHTVVYSLEDGKKVAEHMFKSRGTKKQ